MPRHATIPVITATIVNGPSPIPLPNAMSSAERLPMAVATASMVKPKSMAG